MLELWRGERCLKGSTSELRLVPGWTEWDEEHVSIDHALPSTAQQHPHFFLPDCINGWEPLKSSSSIVSWSSTQVFPFGPFFLPCSLLLLSLGLLFFLEFSGFSFLAFFGGEVYWFGLLSCSLTTGCGVGASTVITHSVLFLPGEVKQGYREKGG